jgi:hypothetical protein
LPAASACLKTRSPPRNYADYLRVVNDSCGQNADGYSESAEAGARLFHFQQYETGSRTSSHDAPRLDFTPPANEYSPELPPSLCTQTAIRRNRRIAVDSHRAS